MIRIVFALFLILHGLVHLLYLGQSWRLFELQPGMVWPDGSWVFSRVVGEETTRLLSSISCIVATLGFAAAGAAILFRQGWWQPAVVGAAIFSSVLYVLFWDGSVQHLDDKGAVGLLINVAILVAVLVLQWPSLEF